MPIELKDVSYVYGVKTPFEKKAVDSVNIVFEDDMSTGLIGHTGSGKSTIAQMLNGLLCPTQGQVLLDGEDINKTKAACRRAKFRVGLVFQYPEYQLFEQTIERDIAYGPRNMGLDEEEITRRVASAAEFVGLSKSQLSKSPFELSGGQRRRAAIAGIIAMEPEFIVFDEPAAGLDPRGRDDILTRIIEYRKAKHSAVIIISHSMEDMAKYCEKIVVMNRGTIYKYGTCEEIFSSPQQLRTVGLNVPQITKLTAKLAESGVDCGKPVYTVDFAVNEFTRLYGELKKHD